MTRAWALESMMSQLSRIERGCQPTGFSGLFTLADEFCETTSLYSSIEDSYLLLVLRKVVAVAEVYDLCVNESRSKGFLNYGPNAGDEREDIENLNQALYTPKLRSYFLNLLISSSVAAAARVMLLKRNFINVAGSSSFLAAATRMILTADTDASVAFQCLLVAARRYPVLACFANGCDFVTLRNALTTQPRTVATRFRANGYEPLFPRIALRVGEFVAWGMWLEAAQAPGEERLSLLKAAVREIGLAVNFMILREGSSPAIRSFYSLYEGASMTEIIREVSRQKLERLPADEYARILERPDQINSPTAYFRFNEGDFRKHQYVVDLPDLDCLCAQTGYSDYEEWKSDPIAFVRKNVENIPGSARARCIQLEYDTMQSALLDATLGAIEERIERRAAPIIREMTPEAIAVIVAESCGLPPIVTPILTLFFRRLLRLLQTDSSTKGA